MTAAQKRLAAILVRRAILRPAKARKAKGGKIITGRGGDLGAALDNALDQINEPE